MASSRDFQVLWTGQVISALGSRISMVAFPLLVLGATGSPAKAGVAMFAGSLPLLVFTLPAGAYVDRLDRKGVMLVCELARFAALGSIPVAIWLGRLSFAQIVIVALVDGTGYAFFEVAQRAALRQIVPQAQLPAAIARIQAREYGALLAGQPLGGVLFGLGRVIPFAVDALSYLVSAASLLLVRTPLQEARQPMSHRLRAEIAEGFAFLWRNPLLRTTSLLATGSDLVLNTLYLVVIVIARERGASSALVGAMFAFIGVGGVLGALVAPAAARRIRPRAIVVGALAVVTLLVPLLPLVPGAVPVGLVYGAMFVAFPAWNAVIGAYRVALVPDRLQGRVESGATLLALGAVPIGSLVVGVLLQTTGSTPTVLILFAVMLLIWICAAASRSVREAPRLDELAHTATLAVATVG